MTHEGVVMLIGAKSNYNHCLILCFLHQIFFKKKFQVEIFCKLSNLISYSTNIQNMKLFH
jgi:hypothetical protein